MIIGLGRVFLVQSRALAAGGGAASEPEGRLWKATRWGCSDPVCSGQTPLATPCSPAEAGASAHAGAARLLQGGACHPT